MTEQTNAELIAEARQLIRHSSVSVPEHANMLGRLADALEAADQRAMQAEAELRDVWRTDIPSLKDARDQLAAVVEKAEDYVTRHYLDTRFGDEVLPMLATAPTDALREVKAEAWDEGYFRRMDDYPFDPEERDNPYRKEPRFR